MAIAPAAERWPSVLVIAPLVTCIAVAICSGVWLPPSRIRWLSTENCGSVIPSGMAVSSTWPDNCAMMWISVMKPKIGEARVGRRSSGPDPSESGQRGRGRHGPTIAEPDEHLQCLVLAHRECGAERPDMGRHFRKLLERLRHGLEPEAERACRKVDPHMGAAAAIWSDRLLPRVVVQRKAMPCRRGASAPAPSGGRSPMPDRAWPPAPSGPASQDPRAAGRRARSRPDWPRSRPLPLRVRSMLSLAVAKVVISVDIASRQASARQTLLRQAVWATATPGKVARASVARASAGTGRVVSKASRLGVPFQNLGK